MVSVDVKHHNNELMSYGASQNLHKGFVVDVAVFLFSVLNRSLNSEKNRSCAERTIISE